MVFRCSDRQWRLKNFYNQPLLGRNSQAEVLAKRGSLAGSSPLCWIALQVPCRFSVLIWSIRMLRISLLSGSAAFSTCPIKPRLLHQEFLQRFSSFLQLSISLLINCMFLSSHYVGMLRGIIKNLSLKRSIERMLLLYSVNFNTMLLHIHAGADKQEHMDSLPHPLLLLRI